MGDVNIKCGITGLPIKRGDSVVVWALENEGKGYGDLFEDRGLLNTLRNISVPYVNFFLTDRNTSDATFEAIIQDALKYQHLMSLVQSYGLQLLPHMPLNVDPYNPFPAYLHQVRSKILFN